MGSGVEMYEAAPGRGPRQRPQAEAPGNGLWCGVGECSVEMYEAAPRE